MKKKTVFESVAKLAAKELVGEREKKIPKSFSISPTVYARLEKWCRKQKPKITPSLAVGKLIEEFLAHVEDA